jgi:hypothetical protein
VTPPPPGPTTFNVHKDEVEEQDRGEDAEVGDDRMTSPMIVSLHYRTDARRVERDQLSDKAWGRQQWEVLRLLPLRATAARSRTL